MADGFLHEVKCMGMFIAKNAEMGIGTLIIFIALLLVAAIAAGVLIQTSGSLQEKALSTGDQAKGQIATNVRVVEVSATDGSTGHLNDFFQLVKLAPGSDAIKIEQALFTLNTFDKTATLKYRGVNGTCERSNTDYNTWNIEDAGEVTTASCYTLEEDYNDDGLDDSLCMISSQGYLWLNWSDGTNYTTTINCSAGENDITGTYTISGSDEISSIAASGKCANVYNNNTLWANVSFNITPKKEGQGYFAVEYLQRGANPIAGNLQRGDVIKLCFEAPRNIGEDENIRINFIPKIGTPTLTEFITPEVISTERVYLYP